MNNSKSTDQREATGRGIPPARELRDRITSAALNYCSSNGLVPPLSFEALKQHTGRLLKDLGMPEEYLRYTAVILNNEIWRETVASIPYHRRLLLLPMCLRNQESCTAVIDEYGLECNRCGQCLIGKCLDEAERLGYVCLVAEGTVIVMSLIESGKVEAVIGVSCLDSLEKVFPYMQAGAVPGIALPLLSDGCKDTHLDTDQLWDTIHLQSGGAAGHLNLESIRDRVDRWFTPEALAAFFPQPGGQAERIALDWMSTGGKHWRPFLAACVHEALNNSGTGSLPEYLQTIGVAIECFHKASLIHDDIEDDDQYRYGRKTLHTEHGIPVALNVGDLLIGEGYRLLASVDLPHETVAAMTAAAADAHRDLCIGQGEELNRLQDPEPPTVEEILHISRHKTAPAFEVALRLGALSAGHGDSFRDTISEFSEAVGIAYQIRDDLLDRERDGRPSIMTALKAIYEDDAEATARRLMDKYKSNALESLSALKEPALKVLLHRVVVKIFYDDETMGCCDDNHPGDDQGS